MNNQIPTTALFEAVKTGENLVRVDVILKNIPENLFGAAFHLRVSGVGWSLKAYEKGDLFAVEGFAPLMLAEEKTGVDGIKEIVFGISLKRTDELRVHDGTLASFYLGTEGDGIITLEFADAHLSLAEPVRKDMENVKWETGTFNTGDLRLQQALSQTNELRREGQVSIYNIELTAVYTVMAVCLLIIIAGAVTYFLLKRWRRFKA